MSPTRLLIKSIGPVPSLPRAARPASSMALSTCIRIRAPAARQSRAVRSKPVGLSLSRRYSAGSGSGSESGETVLSGSRIWSFGEVKKVVDGGESASKVVIVDVREPGEIQSTGKIPGAINIPITSAAQSFHVPEADFEHVYGFERPSRDSTLLFYCKAGVRAKSAAGLAKHAGYESVGEYPGSWLEWEANGGPVERVKAGEGLGQG